MSVRPTRSYGKFSYKYPSRDIISNYMSEKLKTASVIGGLAGARIFATSLDTVLNNHISETHRAAKLHPTLRRAARFEQRTASIYPENWASKHRLLHHQFPDVDAFNFWKTYRLILHAGKTGFDVPQTFKGYDRLVEEFTLDEIMQIGVLMEDYVGATFGERRWTPDFSFLTDEQVSQLLEDPEPKYYYDHSLFRKKEPYTDEEATHIMLRDQHSPLLAPPRKDGSWNGVRYELRFDTLLNHVPTKLFRQRPYLMPEDLRPKSEDPVRNNAPEIVSGFVLFALAASLALKDGSPKGIAKATVAGSLANGLGLLFLKESVGLVNGFGHMGRMTPENIRKAALNRNYEIIPNPDGSIGSDTAEGGWLGAFLGLITYGEATLQWGHHKEPWAIAYPDSNGKVSMKTAFAGTIFERMADSRYLPFIKRGDGLPVDENGRRADEPHPVVEIVHAARRRTMREKNPDVDVV